MRIGVVNILNYFIRVMIVSSLLLVSSCDWINQDLLYIDHEIKNNQLIVNSKIGKIAFAALEGDAIEVHYLKDKHKEYPSFAKKETIENNIPQFEENKQTLILTNGLLQAVINKIDLSVNFYRDNQLLTQQKNYFSNKDKHGFNFKLNDSEKIMGGGERVLGMDRRGHRMPLYNRAHYGYTTSSNQMYYSLPVITSSKKYTILFDNAASGFLDIGKTEKNTLSFEAVSGRASYIVFSADNYPKLINNYVDVTGKQPLPPRWSFGNYASRFGYKTEQQVRETVDKFIADDIPLDTVILDLYWFGKDIKGHVGNLQWDEKAFPTHQKMIDDLKAKGIKTILITEPFILSSSSKWNDAVENKVLVKNKQGEPYRFDFYFGNTGLIDVFDENTQTWFWDIYQNLFEQGVAGTWGDLGEPEVHPDDSLHHLSKLQKTVRADAIHNAYGHQWAKIVFQNQLKYQPNQRPLIMMRSGFAGSQRYGMIPWTGDVDRSWDGLKPQVELSLQMGLHGLAYTHSDLGGFAGGEKFDQELYIRWLQYGVFQPVYRPHAQDHIAPEPVFHDQQTKDIIREFIKLRYRLLPYIYTLAYQNSTTGMPLMRPLFFEDESDTNLIDIKDTYLWGDAFLVSPIVNPNETQHKTILPKGIWFDYWNDKRYQGGQTVDIPVSLKTLPVLVRAGSFIPMIDSINNMQDYSSKNLTLHYYADASVIESHGEMYEDDGVSFDSIEKNNFELLQFGSQHNEKGLTLKLSRIENDYKNKLANRKIKIIVHNWSQKPHSIMVEGENKNYIYDEKSKQLVIEINWEHDNVELFVKSNVKNETKSGIQGKPVVYQVFTRLFGNQKKLNKPWGTKEENGVGKFNDFTTQALKAIKEFGVTHIWYTGVPHHALVGDYTKFGITNDDPDVIKGRAGSPYAVKDYYNVNPDLAVDPANRLQEFKALIQRTHQQGMKVIIDIVPNHIARNYHSISKPEGEKDFGELDDTSVEYHVNNNFYYVVNKAFEVPVSKNNYQPLGGENHPLVDNQFIEAPAKWTGNGSRKAQPDFYDWYETVKINYGVRPDGRYDFPRLPENYSNKNYQAHYDFWKDKVVPDSWEKFRNIALYWMDLGVDGFRYDMAEMVPVEFWSYLNSSIKMKNDSAFLLAEVYNPKIYRDYIQLGKMDYLYDKVDLYDTLKLIIQGKETTSKLLPVIQKHIDIDQHMLHFLENHDEQRIASSGFAGDANKAKPAMVVSALIGRGPTMLYFAQALGEAGNGNAGFGQASRTSIFDYWGIDSLQRWNNDNKFDASLLTHDEKSLREFYVKLLSFSASSKSMRGNYADLHAHNLSNSKNYNEKLFSFVRWNNDEKIMVVSNFSSNKKYQFNLKIPAEIINSWNLNEGEYELINHLNDFENNRKLVVKQSKGIVQLTLEPLESKILQIK